MQCMQRAEEEEEEKGAPNEAEEEEAAEESMALLASLPKWRRRRQLMREALGSSGMFEDLCGVMDGYLGKLEVSELVCVRTIGSKGEGNVQFRDICGISADDRHIAVSNFAAESVSLFDKASGAFIRKFGRHGSGQGQFNGSNGMCLDCSNVYVCESRNNRVQVLTKKGAFVRFIGDASGDGKLKSPTGVSVDEQHVFVADRGNHCIKVFSKEDGQFIRAVGWAATDGTFAFHPNRLSLSDGVLYATDDANHCVAVFEG